ncbi:MAG: DUF1456 family protein [Candidatus Lindowbacteria bacterium]|nr:DUF1456 family protein [Candidatus Lindowbacteria bacterium]
MTNNDILRRLRYMLNYNDSTMADIFALGGHSVTSAAVADFLKREDEPGYVECGHPEMECFLNGLIIHRRGRKEGAPAPAENPHAILLNNDILKKLRIALELQEDDMLAIMKYADVEISRSELSALFRKDGHKHYKDCGDQFLRKFLRGLSVWRQVTQSAGNNPAEGGALPPKNEVGGSLPGNAGFSDPAP